MVDIDAAAKEAGITRKAAYMRIRRNMKRGEPNLLKATLRGGNFKITETQAKEFWRLVSNGWTTEKACKLTGITKSQGDNIRSGKSWNHITGKVKVVYDDY